tara:strand:- start:562 stop:948 length:387 start_codon:yes stop_codon:yes gene_type:complete
MAKVTFTKLDNGGMWDEPKNQEIYVDGVWLGTISQELGTLYEELFVIGYSVDLFGCEALEDESFSLRVRGVFVRGNYQLNRQPPKGSARKLHTDAKNRVREIVANFEGLDEWLASERKLIADREVARP